MGTIVIGHATINESLFKITSTDPFTFFYLGSLEDVQVRTLLSLYTNTKQCPARVTDTRSAHKHDF